MTLQECKNRIENLLYKGKISDKQVEDIQIYCHKFINENTINEIERKYFEEQNATNKDIVECMLRVIDRLIIKQQK